MNRLARLGIKIISLADTVGLATKEQVSHVTKYVVDASPEIEIGVHLHSSPNNREEKLAAAWDAGCRRFDGAIKGIGGCPMAGDALVGNMDTEAMTRHFEAKGINPDIDAAKLAECSRLAGEIFI